MKALRRAVYESEVRKRSKATTGIAYPWMRATWRWAMS